MQTSDKDRTESKATPRGAGGGLQSKGMDKPDAGAANAPRQQEASEHQPEESDQQKTPTADS